MKTEILSIVPGSEPQSYVVEARIDNNMHEFTLHIHEEVIRYITPDEHFKTVFEFEPMIGRKVCSLVIDVYNGLTVSFPVSVEWHPPD